MKKGTPARSDHQPSLTGADFVCDFVKDSDVRQILENCVSAATEAALGKVRDTGVSRKLKNGKNVKGKSSRQGPASASARAILKKRGSLSGRGGGGSSSHRSPSQRSPRGRTPVTPSGSRKGKGIKTSKFDDVHVVSDSSGSADGGQASAPSLLALVLVVSQLAVVQHPHELGPRIFWAWVPLRLTATTLEAHPWEFLPVLAVPSKRDALP
ncbi:hypothetical protein I4F81_008419 [Pyropia yezoensis]|uniref:Uncharacterized protein n=1 Tax=Pyropia yezoensis TaxID=2788 RepID=A0ACC3C826_PYRYE|nr:hypothetical protein I4F81_008419 [Neopyropia yezoensis]